MEKNEGNELIAVFMEHEEGYDEHGVWQKLQYHKSWDCLMPVCTKIYDTTPLDVREINSEGLSVFEFGSIFVPIEDVWLAVVKFIEWHNSQKIIL